MATPNTITPVVGNLVLTPTAPDNQHLVNQLNKGFTTQLNTMRTSIPATTNTAYTVANLLALTGMSGHQRAFVSNGDTTAAKGDTVSATGTGHLSVHWSGSTWVYD